MTLSPDPSAIRVASRPCPPTGCGRHPLTLLFALALWLALAGNLPLWWSVGRSLYAQREVWLVPMLAWGLALTAINMAVLALLVWPRWRRLAGVVLLALVAVPSYFMLNYGVVIDSTMLDNVLHTDAREARELVTPGLMGTLVLGVALPGWWWWRQRVRAVPLTSLLKQQLGVAAAALLAALALLWGSFTDLAPLMRNDKSLRYLINPYNTLYAAARSVGGRAARAQQPLQPVGTDVAPLPVAASAEEAPLVVLVVGETARAANFGLGGYPRATTPRLAALRDAGELVYFTQVQSCGTNTQTSVPCLFSPGGRASYDARRHEENLLDVVQRAGAAVLWLDNQSGCKGVCDRVPTVRTDRLGLPDLCAADECHDEVLLRELPRQLAQLSAEARRHGTLVVLHQMGSHGPAYFRRTPSAFKVFQPECINPQLSACPVEWVVNAYDNTIRYTDHVLAELIAQLRSRRGPTLLLYVSDHGESLGESGSYLHGVPYAIAPREQIHVPMLLWTNTEMRNRLRLDWACVQRQAQAPASHDHVFHTIAGVLGLHTSVVDPGRDLQRACRDSR